MPTQMEIEYWRNRYQRMNWDRFWAANAIALITHTAAQPFDTVKTRAMMLQEGKGFSGLGFQKGLHGINIYNEIMAAGGGHRKFYSKLDAFFLRTTAYTTARVSGFLYFYDWINPDARRQSRTDFYAFAAVAGGLLAGIVTNPVEIVFTRMQADEMYPEKCRRNYGSFIDGVTKVAEEGALMRGAGVNGLRIAGLGVGATGAYDYMKENMFYFFGPIPANRYVATTAGVATAMVLSMPFDTIRTRLHTMRPLPNGKMPYNDALDCYLKMIKFEAQQKNHSNLGCFYTGGQPYFARLWVIAIMSQYCLDYYHAQYYQQEFWQPARFHYNGALDYDIHDPYTDGFNAMMQHTGKVHSAGFPGLAPDGKTTLKAL